MAADCEKALQAPRKAPEARVLRVAALADAVHEAHVADPADPAPDPVAVADPADAAGRPDHLAPNADLNAALTFDPAPARRDRRAVR